MNVLIDSNERHYLFEPFEQFLLYLPLGAEESSFVSCLKERQYIANALLNLSYSALGVVDYKPMYNEYIDWLISQCDVGSVLPVIERLVGMRKIQKQTKCLSEDLNWNYFTFPTVILAFERLGYAYSSYSHTKNFDQTGLGSSMIISDESDIDIAYSETKTNLACENESRIKTIIEQSNPRMLIVFEKSDHWFAFEMDRRSLLGLEKGSHGSHFHLHSSNKYNNISKKQAVQRFAEDKLHTNGNHVGIPYFGILTVNLPARFV